jgi:putative glutathione S-transferase
VAITVDAQFPNEQTEEGEYARQEDAFQNWVTQDAGSRFPAVKGRYHLYVSLACPWAHRTIIFRKLKKLEDVIGMTVVDPIRDGRGWAFREGPCHSLDPINGFSFLSEAYTATDSTYQDRVTVPVLWDTATKKIVSNSDDDIIRMFNSEFNQCTNSRTDFYPLVLREEIDQLNEHIYDTINNGVYRAGFATSQSAYEKTVTSLFASLDELEERLSTRRYLLGDCLVETDWRLFVTLIRFDPVYHGHFKCNIKRIMDYPNLFGYLRELYQMEGIAETVNFDHIKRHYYITHDVLPALSRLGQSKI